MKKKSIFLITRSLVAATWVLAIVTSSISSLNAQSSDKTDKITDAMVRNRLRQIALGNANSVRSELPTLLAEHKGDAGMEYLNAILMTEPNKSLLSLERIVRESPKSQWADDAQWRVVQAYALQRDTVRAREELQQFRRDYPNSEFLIFASEMVKSTVGLPASFANRATSLPAASAIEPTLATSVEKKSLTAPLTTKTSASNANAVKPTLGQAAEADGQRYALQVGVYMSEQSAASDMQKLIKARIRADVIEKKVGDQSRFAVLAGDYSSRVSAEKGRAVVQKYCKCLPFVVLR